MGHTFLKNRDYRIPYTEKFENSRFHFLLFVVREVTTTDACKTSQTVKDTENQFVRLKSVFTKQCVCFVVTNSELTYHFLKQPETKVSRFYIKTISFCHESIVEIIQSGS